MQLKKVFFYIIGTFTLLIPAFYNGYPLVYSDTGSYLFNGMELTIPKDRPTMYGLFVHLFSLNFSLWLVIFMQSFIVFYVLWHVFKLATKPSIPKWFFILSMALMSWFTGLGWYTSQIMPDIFTIVTLCTLALLLFKKNHSRLQTIFFSILLIFAMNTHFSNYLIAILTIIILFIITRRNGIPNAKKEVSFRLPVLVTILAIAVGSMTNFMVGSTFKLSQNSHVFLMGKMLDSGVLKSFLDDNCATKNYTLCDCKNTLPETSRNLLWDTNSPLQKNGDWQNSEASYNEILVDIVTSPKHLSLFLYNDFCSSLTQLFQNEVGSGVISNWYSDPTSPPYQAVAKYFPFELNQYKQSRQNTNLWEQNLDLTLINFITFFLLIIAVIALIYVFFVSKIGRQYTVQTQVIIYTILIGIITNAIVTSSLANVYDRLQARVSWALVFCLLLLFTQHKTQLSNRINAFLKN
ncbi:hypothetical protein [Flavobacterium sp. N1994]|uniref:hypothetical protein n=1 Tax=Flavobacterium sp. N1994 TaxID=2986827 RepID=UPI0022231FB0|nr:hypothetical protein [Flavobacterium sp. N1994]